MKVTRSQSRFNMTDRNLRVECRKCRCERRSRITLNKHDIGRATTKYIGYAIQNPCS